jgi:hypothetical protein
MAPSKSPPVVDPVVLTLEEAATRLRIGLRGFRDWINMHPTDSAGAPLYFTNGNRKLFTERDIERIIQELRNQEQRRLVSLRPAAKRRSNRPAARMLDKVVEVGVR